MKRNILLILFFICNPLIHAQDEIRPSREEENRIKEANALKEKINQRLEMAIEQVEDFEREDLYFEQVQVLNRLSFIRADLEQFIALKLGQGPVFESEKQYLSCFKSIWSSYFRAVKQSFGLGSVFVFVVVPGSLFSLLVDLVIDVSGYTQTRVVQQDALLSETDVDFIHKVEMGMTDIAANLQKKTRHHTYRPNVKFTYTPRVFRVDKKKVEVMKFLASEFRLFLNTGRDLLRTNGIEKSYFEILSYNDISKGTDEYTGWPPKLNRFLAQDSSSFIDADSIQVSGENAGNGYNAYTDFQLRGEAKGWIPSALINQLKASPDLLGEHIHVEILH